ncbi:hypothetical protein LMG33818_000414 [Halomonadaceae bacterium LMG 33818]|uniref:SixA phosphatase family protein n=1 Tax=Cernens ardua TaxID=3402176 RepID=UPI003EDB7577
MQLCIMRHGDAMAGTPDSQRGLSELGTRECRLAGGQVLQWLNGHYYSEPRTPIVIYSSPYRRAQQSAGLLSDVLEQSGWVIEHRTCAECAPDANPNLLVEQWCGEEWQGLRILVSHMPLVSNICALWVEGNTRSATAMQTSEWKLLEADVWASGCAMVLHHYYG